MVTVLSFEVTLNKLMRLDTELTTDAKYHVGPFVALYRSNNASRVLGSGPARRVVPPPLYTAVK